MNPQQTSDIKACFIKEDEDIYMAVVESIRLMALIHLLYFDETSFKTHA